MRCFFGKLLANIGSKGSCFFHTYCKQSTQSNQRNNLVEIVNHLTLEERFISPQRSWLLSPVIIKSLEVVCGSSQKLLSPTVKNCLQDDRICETQSFHIYSNLNKQWDHSKNRFRTERSIHKKKVFKKMF